MIKKELQTKTTQAEVIIDVICNSCGESMMINYGSDYTTAIGLINGVVDGCYQSTALLDLNRYKFSLCEKCLVNLFSAFKIPPEISEYDIGTDEDTDQSLTWEEDREIWNRMESRKYTEDDETMGEY